MAWDQPNVSGLSYRYNDPDGLDSMRPGRDSGSDLCVVF